ncbi:MAG: bifunctional metallophosphatase/5'-nucleotidase [Erysipelotrichaceae bacterium]|nr:bifunctional metallophosphatase/5'-nucleotidase [Erysipelotrichaceae bacterium]
MNRYKQLKILHSNDMHGDFYEENVADQLVGGVSRLSGYIDKVRQEHENTLYCIAGDMFQGNIIDTEYRGLSTIEIMNALSPDIATLGNHEVDYGVAHLLFLEKCAKFPIINANLYIKSNYARLFKPHAVIEIGGMKVLFIGIITEEVIAQTKKEALIGSFVDIHEAAKEIGKICNAYNATDVDLTVLLTHIGFEEDKQLAQLLDPAWGVDIIIGGHTHTVLEKPEIVNDIVIVQAGTGTDLIGRFDLVIDTQENKIENYTWKCVPITDENCPKDEMIETIINDYKKETDKKYGRIVTRLRQKLTHPIRNTQTELGNLFSDILKESLTLDLMLLGSGGLRVKEIGPIITYKDLTECMPYDDPIYLLTVTGAQLKHMLTFMLRDEALSGEHTEFYQLSKGFKIIYQKDKKEITTFIYNEQSIADEQLFKVGLEKYHYLNFEDFFDISLEEIKKNKAITVVSTSTRDVIEEYLMNHQHLDKTTNKRVEIL